MVDNGGVLPLPVGGEGGGVRGVVLPRVAAVGGGGGGGGGWWLVAGWLVAGWEVPLLQSLRLL